VREIYTPAQLAFLREHYPKLGLADLANAFNGAFGSSKTSSQIRAACKNHKIRCGRTTGEINKGKFTLLTPEQVMFVKDNYSKLTRRQLCLALNEVFGSAVRESQLISFLKNQKITCGRTGHFPKGNVPYTAGTKGFVKPNSGNFKKGNRPHNAVPVGSTTVDEYGYHKIKVAEPNVWEFIHRQVYERTHGPIPADHNIVFINGDRDDCSLENLELVTQSEHAVRNRFGYSKLPTELKPIAKTVVRLRMKAAALRKNRKNASRAA